MMKKNDIKILFIMVPLIIISSYIFASESKAEIKENDIRQSSELLDGKEPVGNTKQLNKEKDVTIRSLRKLINNLNDQSSEPFKIELINPTNWIVVFVSTIIPLGSMVITIAIVIFQTRKSIFTINNNTQKTLKVYEESMKSQKEIAENNLKAQVNSKNRQEWINILRTYVADFITLIQMKRCKLKDKIDKENDWRISRDQYEKSQNKEDEIKFEYDREEYWQAKQQHQETQSELNRTLAKVELLLNPNEKDSIELIKVMRVAYDLSCNVEKAIGNEKENNILLITQKAQNILKAEWEKVKKLE